MTRLLLVDATNVVMRCASIPDVEPQAAVQTALGIVLRAVRVTRATHLVCAFDSPDESLRKRAYPEYKAGRTTKTSIWVDAACAVFEMARVYCLAAPGYEADDVIATIARRATHAPVEILSSDSDLLVLAGGAVTVWQFDKTGDGGFAPRSPAWICQKYGIPTPSHLTLYKTLVGETSDNVPGVPKVGPVKARRLIEEFDTLAMMRGLGVLGEHHAWAEQAYELIRLYDDAPVPIVDPRLAKVTLLIDDRRQSA